MARLCDPLMIFVRVPGPYRGRFLLMTPTIAITAGEPAGIGPEVTVKAVFSGKITVPITLVGPEAYLRQTAERLGFGEFPANVFFDDVPCVEPPVAGVLNPANGASVIEMLTRAAAGAQSGKYTAVVTGPVQKSVLDIPGLHFTGHTEFFRDFARVSRVVMMLVSSPAEDALRVALATTHLPLKEVPGAITPTVLNETLAIVSESLSRDFGFENPRIAVTGLNPHAGESGHMGTEETEVIEPAIERACAAGINATGPWPADTIFVASHAQNYDCILCMYHDQGLPALKRDGFGHGVNITLGLPWIRTSVDHGTALNIAGHGCADEGSMLAALAVAKQMCRHRASRS